MRTGFVFCTNMSCNENHKIVDLANEVQVKAQMDKIGQVT